MSAANVAVSDDRLKASRVSTLTRTVTRLDRSRMTTLAALAVVVLVVACAQRLADRGWRERIICNRLLQADLAQSFCEAEVAGLGIRDLEYPRRRAARKVRKINAANAFTYVGAALVLHGLLGVDVLPTAVILTVMVTAQSFGLSSLFDDVVRRRRGHLDHADPLPAGEIAPRCVGLVCVAGIAFASFWLILTASEHFATDGFFSASGFGLVLAGVLLAAYVTTPARLIERRLLARRQSTRFGAATTSDEVLLLRAFDDDAKRVRWSMAERGPLSSLTDGGYVRFEELLAAFIKTEANLVAIGRPGEKLPLLGAARTYWADDQWQEAVRQTAESARYIVMIAGTTEGLRWEIVHLRKWGLLERCLFVIPPGSTADTAARIERLCDELEISTDALEGLPSPAAIGFCISPRGRLIAYVCNGREWLDYGALLTAFGGVLDGSVTPPEHGALAQHCGYPITVEAQ